MVLAEIKEKIAALKEERKAVILAHNYQVAEVQELADHTGDSFELSRIAAESEAEVIVFCGVHFMAESAAILAPDKIVLLPEAVAGCPMADMVAPEELRQWKENYHDASVASISIPPPRLRRKAISAPLQPMRRRWSIRSTPGGSFLLLTGTWPTLFPATRIRKS